LGERNRPALVLRLHLPPSVAGRQMQTDAGADVVEGAAGEGKGRRWVKRERAGVGATRRSAPPPTDQEQIGARWGTDRGWMCAWGGTLAPPPARA